MAAGDQMSYGAFIKLEEGIEGLCHVSELDTERIENPEDKFSIGQELDFKVIKMNLLERKIGLSIKALLEPDREEMEDTWSYSTESGRTSIGEIAGDQLGQLKKKVEPAKEDEDDEG